MYQIYLITNTVNGKVYVGKTASSLSIRWSDHVRRSKYKETLLARAIVKYTKDSFIITNVDFASCNDEACTLEQMYIRLYRSNDKHIGYNLTSGGDGGNTLSEKKRKELSEKSRLKTGILSPNYNHDIVDKDIEKLFLGGKSSREIGKILGSEKSLILNRLKKMGYELSGRRKTGKDHHCFKQFPSTEEIVVLYSQGLTAYEIAEKVGASYSTIYLKLKQSKIPLRKNRKKKSDASISPIGFCSRST